MRTFASLVALAAALTGVAAPALASLQKAGIEKWWPILKVADVKGQ